MQNNPQTKELVKKIKALMVVRLILVTSAMVTGYFVIQLERIPFYSIIGIFYFATFLYAILLRTKIDLYFQAYLQVIIDTILATAVIHYAGGADSIYAFLYAPSIVASGLVISTRAAKTIAGISSILYGAISGLEFYKIIPPIPGAGELYKEGIFAVLFIVSFRIIIFCLVGYLSSYLSRELFKERAELFKLRNLNELILNNITSGVLTLDTASNVVYANPMALKVLGRSKKDLLYWPNLFWGGADVNIIDRFIIQAKAPGGTEVDMVRPDGKKLILCCSYADLLDEKDRIIGGVLTFIDITPLKEMELEIRQREKLSAMGEMAVGIAHEIRNPMASIKGALEVLKEKCRFQEEDDRLVGVIFKEQDRLNRVIEDFLKYAKERKPAVKYEDLGGLIDEVWLLVRQEERWHGGVELEKKISPPQIILQIDSDQIKQVFYNLFINSLEAMPQGGKIWIDINEGLQEVIIVVKDNGIGIPKEELDKIFQRFYSTKSYGLGMGLSITRRIIESHRGTIQLHSEEEKGTTVTIVLPK